MDKQLRNLKKQFEQIPTSFTETDKQAVRNKIKELEDTPVKRNQTSFPKVFTGTAIACIMVILIIVNIPSNLFLNSSYNDGANSSGIMNIAQYESYDSNSDAVEDSADSSENAEVNTMYSLDEATIQFDPGLIEKNMLFGDLIVQEISQENETTIITFEGTGYVTGQFASENPLTFIPDEASLHWMPIAEGDTLKEITFYIANEDTAQTYLEDNKATSINLTLSKLEYHYTPDGSVIYFTIMEE